MTYNKTSLKKRMKRTDSKKSKIKNKLGLTGLQIALIAFIVVVVIVGSAVLGIAKGIIDSAPDISRIDVVPTGYSTSVYADDGTTEIATLVGSGANREYVTLDRIPDHLQQAFVAIEDARFYEHNGIDLQGIARAGVAALKKIDENAELCIYNLGTGHGYSVLDIVKNFEAANGIKIPYVIKNRRPGDIATCYCDPRKAKEEMGWEAQYGIKEMCEDAWRWQSNNPNGYEA